MRRTLDALELRGGLYVRAIDVCENDVILDLYAPDLEVVSVGHNAIGDVVIRAVGMTLLQRPDDHLCVRRAVRERA